MKGWECDGPVEKVGDLGERRGEGGKVEPGITDASDVVAGAVFAWCAKGFGSLLGCKESHRGPGLAGESGVSGRKCRSKRARW